DLQHVLRVLLAGVGEIEAADEDDVVTDDDLGVHVIVHGAGGIGRRMLAGEVPALQDETERRRLPRSVPVLAPLIEHLVDLRRVDHASSVQFVEPLHTASRSRTTYLWCMRSGQPGMPTVSNGSDSISEGSVFGGGGIGG